MKTNTQQLPHKALIAATSLLVGVPAVLAQDGPVVNWYTIDGGGRMWTTDAVLYELSGTIGQPDAAPDVLTGGGFELTGGFWPGSSIGGPPMPGDCDGDDDVDLADYTVFVACMAGPENGLATGCTCSDLDGDVDVDSADWAAFQRSFTGELR
jgi:hypothetical protein